MFESQHFEMSAPNRKRDEVRERPRSGLKWLKKQRNSESLNSLKTILIFIICVSIVYLVIVTSIGQNENNLRAYIQNAFKRSDSDEDGRRWIDGKVEKFKQYYYISGGVSIFVMICCLIGVIRESPIVSMIAAMFCLLSVAQSISSNSSNFSGQTMTDSQAVRLHSPVIMIALLGSLLTVYTALIWSSEFETPPQIKEEYKWYLDRMPQQHKSSTIGSSAASTMSGYGNNLLPPSVSARHQSTSLHSSLRKASSSASTANRSSSGTASATTVSSTVSSPSLTTMIMASDLNQ